MRCSCLDPTEPTGPCSAGERHCPTCAEPLTQRPEERPNRFERRRFCSNQCAVRNRKPRIATPLFARDDFLHEVWFGRVWLGWTDERIAAWLGLSWEAFYGRLMRAEGVGQRVDEDDDRWAAA